MDRKSVNDGSRNDRDKHPSWGLQEDKCDLLYETSNILGRYLAVILTLTQMKASQNLSIKQRGVIGLADLMLSDLLSHETENLHMIENGHRTQIIGEERVKTIFWSQVS